ncbi:MAG: mucoidy inhibitor MuiA family protein [Hahellaceae bacterium]|nr:mucoidy inhibitor MuiA family protein [Hahellaceae bacterium]MCP5168172.1 mucoidy inhibitor MuiA family protein [Hahellaceae bacterium]
MTSLPDQQNLIYNGAQNRISAVTVFTSHALIMREAQAQCHAGLSPLVLEVNAFDLDEDSLQAEVLGRGSIVGVQLKRIPQKDYRQPELAALETQLKQLQRQRKTLQKRVEIESKRAAFLDSVASFANVQVGQEIQTGLMSAGKLRETLDFMSESYAEVATCADELEHQLEALDAEIKLIESRQRIARQSDNKTLTLIEVLFDSAEEQALTLHVSYLVKRAGWTPIYKVDVSGDREAQVSFMQFAKITQNTGEDWDNVSLRVSNAAPVRHSALPEIGPWWVNVAPPVPLSRAVSAPAAAVMASPQEYSKKLEDDEALYDLDEALAAPAVFAEAESHVQGVTFEHQLPQRYQIKSGGDEVTLPLQRRTPEGHFYHYVVPALDTQVFLVCEIKPDGQWLSGAVNVFFDGRFVASTTLEDNKADQPLRFNLGVDRGIKVERRKVTDKLSETFFGRVDRSSVVREMEFLTVISNLKTEAITLHCEDHLPVAINDRIQIKDLEISPAPTETSVRDLDGVVRWELPLMAESTQKLSVRFFVKAPKELQIVGL